MREDEYLLMCRHVLTQLLSSHTKPSTLHYPLTVLLFVLTLTLALHIDDLGPVQSLVGSVCAVSLVFLIPSACAIRVSQLKEGRGVWDGDNVGALLIAGLGVGIVGLTIVNQLTDWMGPSLDPLSGSKEGLIQ
jgi:amino acid permease